jgi:hypothetical protein
MFLELPENHNLGIVQVLAGKGGSYELVDFLTGVKNITVTSLLGPGSAKETFRRFFDGMTAEPPPHTRGSRAK